jgi:hypothetical protein
MLSDHTRILLKSINALGYEVVKNEVCHMQPGMVNQSSAIVIKKSAPATES